jgi:excisionase family DNA binding protein
VESLSNSLGLLSTKEVALRLGVSVAKVHRLIAKGVLTPVTKAGGQTGSYYFEPDALPDPTEPEQAAS